LGLAREMRSDLRIESFRWTPFSIFYDRFADKEPLFHFLLMPLAGLSLERAGLAATLIGLLALAGAFGWAVWRSAAPQPWLLVLSLCGLGPMFALRADMCRPHVWLIAFSFLVLGMLAYGASWKLLAGTCAAFGLAHTGGWIAVAYAAVWAVAGYASRRPSERRLEWRPLAAAAGGWLAGQLVHPNVPANFRLFWLQNFVVPYQSAAGGEALRSQIGNELTPPEGYILFEQLPAFIAPALVLCWLLFQPRLRTRASLTVAAFALAFTAVGSLFMRRFFELGAPLALLALALLLAESRGSRREPTARRWLIAAVAMVLLGALWTWMFAFAHGFGVTSPPRAMARWLGAHGGAGERVFTAQWGDSAPIFYFAPQLQSLVVLDPTFFLAKDPELFETYVRIVQGRHPDPGRAIRETFGARWVTLWKQPVYRSLVQQLGRTNAVVAFDDADYLILDLGSDQGAGRR
jgi:hypothetical protein